MVVVCARARHAKFAGLRMVSVAARGEAAPATPTMWKRYVSVQPNLVPSAGANDQRNEEKYDLLTPLI
jgi:hypothetical protein